MIKLNKEKIKCLNCGKLYFQRSIRQKYCGSRQEKIGCSYIVKKQYNLKYLRENIDKVKLSQLRNRSKINERRRIKRKIYRKNNPIKKVERTKEELLEMSRVRNRRYYKKNRVRIIKRQVENNKEKLKDINYRLLIRMRYRLWVALKGKSKHKKTLDLIGCSIKQLRIYIEKQFKEGMSWDNYGRKGWTIDHIKPLSSFNLSNQNELEEASHYTNLQPLWELDNIKKGSKML